MTITVVPVPASSTSSTRPSSLWLLLGLLTMRTALIFAGDGLDRGTAVLLRASTPPTGSPRVLDLGCGWGPIALGIAVHTPGARVDAVDVNDRALGLCRDNARALGVADRVRALRPEQVEDDRRYDQIWSNPPIRVGKDALHALLAADTALKETRLSSPEQLLATLVLALCGRTTRRAA